MSAHRVKIETQTWRNVPPYGAKTMFRAACKCGWRSEWYVYEENVPRKCDRA